MSDAETTDIHSELYNAALAQQWETVAALIKVGASVTDTNYRPEAYGIQLSPADHRGHGFYGSAFHYICLYGDIQDVIPPYVTVDVNVTGGVVKLDKIPDCEAHNAQKELNKRRYHGSITPLMAAVYSRNRKNVSWLLQQGANLHAETNETETALSFINTEDILMLRLLISSGLKKFTTIYGLGDVTYRSKLAAVIKEELRGFNGRMEPDVVKKHTDYKSMSVLEAAAYGNLHWLLDETAELDVNVTDNTRNTLLHHAVTHSRLNNVQLLLDNYCNVNAQNNAGLTPLHIAIQQNNTNLVKLMLGVQDIDVNLPDCHNDTPLHAAVRKGNLPVVHMLMRRLNNANLEAKNNDDENPIHLSIKLNFDLIAKFLINHQSSPLDARCNWSTSLHLATFGHKYDIVKCLISNQCDVDATDADLNTALHVATMIGDAEIIQLLLENEATINIQNGEGNTPLHFGVTRGVDIIEQLTLPSTCLADMEVRNNDDQSVLEIAILSEDEKLVESVLSGGAHPDGEDTVYVVQNPDEKDMVKMVAAECNLDHEPDESMTIEELVKELPEEQVLPLVEELREVGLVVNVDSVPEKSPLDLADNQRCVELLVLAGASKWKRGNVFKDKVIDGLMKGESLQLQLPSSGASIRKDSGIDDSMEEVTEIPCKVCRSESADVMLNSCHHLCICEKCYNKVTHCPVCREKISGKTEVFLS